MDHIDGIPDSLKDDISIDWDRVEREMVKKEKISRDTSAALSQELLECLQKARDLSRPQVLYAIRDVISASSERIELSPSAYFTSNKIASYLKKAHKLIVFVVTIGADIENTASKMMREGEELRGYLMDRIGAFAVESLAENLENELRSCYALRNLSLSMRLSPGYCDWSIEEQFKIARILDLSNIGVELTESCMMVPKKSISGILGIGKQGLYSKKISQCAVCDKIDCIYRRAP